MALINRKAKSFICGVFTCLIVLLAGCNTSRLSDSIQDDEAGKTFYNSDNILGLSLGVSPNGEKGWVFIGEHFDYLVPSGVERIAALLQSQAVDTSHISVALTDGFTIIDKNEFSGSVRLTYNQPNMTADQQKTLRNAGFYCQANSPSEPCVLNLDRLRGKIHQKNKNQDDSKIIYFHKPFNVKFYKPAGLSAKRALYPLSVAADVVTLPIQLVAAAIMIPSLAKGFAH